MGCINDLAIGVAPLMETQFFGKLNAWNGPCYRTGNDEKVHSLVLGANPHQNVMFDRVDRGCAGVVAKCCTGISIAMLNVTDLHLIIFIY